VYFADASSVHINLTKLLTTMLNRLIFFSDIIIIYCKNHTIHTNTPCKQNTTAGGICS